MTFAPTPEQVAIQAAARDSRSSLMIDALAGCAKTTTLELIAKEIHGPALALAFNVKIKKELEARFPSSFEVKTMNGLGHNAWCKAIGKRLGVEEKKLSVIFNEALKESGWDREIGREGWSACMGALRKARHVGLIPSSWDRPCVRLTPDTPDVWLDLLADEGWYNPPDEIPSLLCAVLHQSILQSYRGVIDYDDQIYMSALFGGAFPRYPLVMVDEAQDLSPLNHRQVQRVAADRLIVCGDPRQAIYAFRGADSDSMGKLRALREAWIDLPLSTTFRCPRAIVERQHSHAPGYTAAPSNAEGHVERFAGKWTWDSIAALLPKPGASVAILCRNNAPLLRAAFRLIRHGRGCTMLGRDIGKSLITTLKKICPDDSTSTDDAIRLVLTWRDRETALARANDKDSKVQQVEDRAECLLAVLEDGGVKNVGEARQKLHQLFEGDEHKVVLGTGHRAKGLEWDVVLHLDPWRLPSKWAKAAEAAGDDRPMEQEKNLRYVIETRAKHTLLMGDLEKFYREEDQ